MRIEVDYQGETYVSPEDTDNDCTAEKLADQMYSQFSNITKFKMELKGGGFILFGETACKSAVFRVVP